MKDDFIFLNVSSLMNYYSNPSHDWVDKVRALAQTQVDFFYNEGLLNADANILHVPIEDVVLKFSDFTAEGRAFLKTAATDKWLAACDKKNTVTAYSDPSGLSKRLKSFRAKGAKIVAQD